MTQPIGTYSRAIFFPDPATDLLAEAAVSLCKSAPPTVAGGFLCDEPTTTSDACRSPNNAVDAYVCDDNKMAAAQRRLWSGVKEFLKTAFTVLIGRAP